VGEKRTKETFQKFFDLIGTELAQNIEFVCSDMWKPYLDMIKLHCTGALNILDRFHIVAKLNLAIDEIRAGEAHQLVRDGYEPVLKKSRWCLLKRPVNLTDSQCWRRCKSDIRRRRKVGVKASGTVSSCCRQLSGVLAPESEWIGLVVTRMRVSRRRALFAQHFVERNLIARDDALAQIIEEFDDGERLIGRPVARDQEVQSMGDT
jgi:hypothetical protein